MTRAFCYVGAQFGPFDVDENAFRFLITDLSPHLFMIKGGMDEGELGI
jgi:hypothetical protein